MEIQEFLSYDFLTNVIDRHLTRIGDDYIAKYYSYAQSNLNAIFDLICDFCEFKLIDINIAYEIYNYVMMIIRESDYNLDTSKYLFTKTFGLIKSD